MQFIVLSSRCLTKSINGFLELTNMKRMVRVNKALRLLHENTIREFALQEGIVNIQLM